MGMRLLGLLAVLAVAGGSGAALSSHAVDSSGTLTVAVDTTGGWRRALAGDTVVVPVRAIGRWARGDVLAVRWSARGEEVGSFPLPPLTGEDSVLYRIPVALPYVEGEEESLAVEARRDSSRGGLLARTVVPIGPTTAGEPFAIPIDPGPAEGIDLCYPFLLVREADGFRLFDLGSGTEVEGAARSGRDASLGKGFALYERRGRIHRLEIASGTSRPISDPNFPGAHPAAGDSLSAWFRSCCGTFGEIFLHPAQGEAFSFPLGFPASGRPSVRAGRAAWLESDGETWAVWTANLATRGRALVHRSDDSLLAPSVGSEGIAFAARRGTQWVLLLHRFAEGTIDTIAGGGRDLRDPAFGSGFLAWSEEAGGERDLRGRRLADGRAFPISLAPGRQGPFALDDSLAVWLEERGEESGLRGLRIRLPVGPSPILRLRFHRARFVRDRVLLEWSVEGPVDRAPYSAFRDDGDSGAGGVLVARGALDGPGYYFCEDRTLPAAGERQRVRYSLSVEVPGGPLHFGPVAVLLPDRYGALSIEPEGPNPTAGPVRFAIEVPVAVEGMEAAFCVYDCGGRRIRDVVAGRLRSGRASVVWDRRTESGREAAAGVYFLRFRVGSAYTETKKVILLPSG